MRLNILYLVNGQICDCENTGEAFGKGDKCAAAVSTRSAILKLKAFLFP